MKLFKHLFFIIFYLSFFQLQAQISIGVKSGYTRAWQSYGDVSLPDDAEIHVEGFHVSLISNYQLNKYFRIGMEPGYIERGAACIPGWNGRSSFVGDTKLLLKYIEIPIMFSGVLPLFNEKIEVFAKTGFGLSFMVKGTQEETIFGSDIPPVRTDIDFENMNRLDNGIYGGLGITYNFGKNSLFLEYENYWSLRDADKNNTSKNRSYDVSIGYLFRLSK